MSQHKMPSGTLARNYHPSLPAGKSIFPYVHQICPDLAHILPIFSPRLPPYFTISSQDPRHSPYFPYNLGKTILLKDRITPHVTNFFRLRLTIEKQEGKRKYKSDGAVMVGEFVCMYVCSCTVSE